METVARATRAYVDELRKAGWSASRLPAGTREKLNTPAVRAAGERTAAYQRQACGATP